MGKNNKCGFTLVELLAVIVILGLLGLIVFPAVDKTIKKSKENLYKEQVSMIESGAKKWILKNISKISETDNIYLSIDDIIKGGYLVNKELKDPRNNKVMNGCVVVTFDDNYNQYEYKYHEEVCDELRPYVDPSGANAPELATGMIPVKWNGTNWVKVDLKKNAHNIWYDYNNQVWANAVTVTSVNRLIYKNSPDGTVIPMSDINTMWVWIPRYKYAIPAGSGAREINIVFESKNTSKSNGDAIGTNYRTHPAFTFGTNEVSGIWVGKFETTGTIGSPTILPNITSLRTQAVKTMYDSSRTMENNATYGFSTQVNIHMMKNSEWGAVAYLSHSKYGKYGNNMYTGINKEIYQNKSSGFITGNSNGTPSQSNANEQCTYDDITDRGNGTGACGAGASTTGNIYGVYDMSGGTDEYVMGIYRPSDTTYVADGSGFGAGTTLGILPDSKYWSQYLTTDFTTACNGICYGEALGETNGWYGDDTYNISTFNPWFVRGGWHNENSTAGIFAYGAATGTYTSISTFRITLLNI